MIREELSQAARISNGHSLLVLKVVDPQSLQVRLIEHYGDPCSSFHDIQARLRRGVPLLFSCLQIVAVKHGLSDVSKN